MPSRPSVAERAKRLSSAFDEATGHPPCGVWAAPGRVNLIGEHTDYNAGWVLPVAIDRRCLAAVAPREDRIITCRSLDIDGTAATPIDELAPGSSEGWARYALGVAWALQKAGVALPGADVVVSSDVPSGSGLASSAALEVSVAIALADLAGAALPPGDLALAVQRAERDYAGAPVGLMDPLAALLCRRDCALLVDCRSLEHQHVELGGLGLELVVVDTGVHHSNAAGRYSERRRACENAAITLGVPSLRDATPDRIDELHDDDLRMAARHVVTENHRVLQTVDALRTGDTDELGDLFAASHASLRDDFRVSCPELDVAVDSARDGGAVAARMTGAGFGGCVVALAESGAVPQIEEAVAASFAAQDWAPPTVWTVTAPGPAARLQ